jgi:CubicO group peptidase (beta-lactamase class C family)
MQTLLVSFFLLCNPQSASDADALKSYLDSQAPKGFHGVLYVEQDGRELFWHTVGYADRDRKKPFSKDSLFDIGSIVKPMVKVARMKAVSKGLIRQDDTLPKFFANVPEDKRAITIDQLASHRAGFDDTFGGDYELIGRDELMKTMLTSTLIFAPGSQMKYSNSGYSMLAAILEQVTGRSIEAFVAETNFRPVGIKRIGYVLPKWNRSDLVFGYRRNGQPFGTPLDHRWAKDGPSWHLRGNGGMLATAPDLAKWVRAVHEGVLLNKDEHKLFAPRLYADDATRRIWGVLGGNGVFNTLAAYHLEKRLVIVGASIDGRFEIESLGRELIDKVAALAK